MIETVCWPFWTRGRPDSFTRHSLHLWALSACLGARWFPHARLVADELATEILAKKLQLPFTECLPLEVPARLDFMPLMGKHYAHRVCAKAGDPYLMLDYDFFLWRRPDEALLRAPGVVQLREASNPPVNKVIDRLQALNPEVKIPRYPFACNAGASGGNDLDTIARWTDMGISLAEDPKNEPALRLGDGWVPASAFDETLLMAFFGDRMAFLMEPKEGKNDEAKFERAGFTHLAGPSKHDPLRRLQVETRLGLMFPAVYECVQRVWFDDLARG